MEHESGKTIILIRELAKVLIDIYHYGHKLAIFNYNLLILK